ncbi:MAG TPA: 50S ribosomal protein L11 methyltransferase [Anaerolineales bacterium]|nr:50S ribosomal protein L11 methyltransferase [Anaerolineales bacterium]
MGVLFIAAVLVTTLDVSLYVPTPIEAVVVMLEVAEVKKDDVVYDLGCGNGQIIVLASASYGCRSVGIDIDPECVRVSKANVKRNGVEDLVRVYEQDARKVDLESATVVTCYLMPDLLVQLKSVFAKMKTGSRVICYDKAIPGIKVTKTIEIRGHSIYLYRTPLVACSGST